MANISVNQAKNKAPPWHKYDEVIKKNGKLAPKEGQFSMMDSKFENIHWFTEILHLVSCRLLSNLVRQTLGNLSGSNTFRKTRAFALRSTTLKSTRLRPKNNNANAVRLSYLKNVNIPTANTARWQNLKNMSYLQEHGLLTNARGLRASFTMAYVNGKITLLIAVSCSC